jgi:hypothetical protein
MSLSYHHCGLDAAIATTSIIRERPGILLGYPLFLQPKILCQVLSDDLKRVCLSVFISRVRFLSFLSRDNGGEFRSREDYLRAILASGQKDRVGLAVYNLLCTTSALLDPL